MSRSVNRITLLGHTGSDPEIRTTTGGTMVAKLSLATNDYGGKDAAGNPVEQTNWHRLTFFSRLAEIVEQYVGKGDRLYVEGRVEYSQTEGEDGHTRYWCDVVVNELVMLGSVDQERGAVPTPRGPVEDPEGDDLPFAPLRLTHPELL